MSTFFAFSDRLYKETQGMFILNLVNRILPLSVQTFVISLTRHFKQS